MSEPPGPGWWIASDGQWYPPELHPAVVQTATRSIGERPNDELKPLRHGGTCWRCGSVIAVRAVGWHDPTAPPGKKITCMACKPASASAGPSEPTPRSTNPVGGSSALRTALQRRDKSWQKGAVGEYLLTRFLREHLPQPYLLLADRQVPHTNGNIDLIVVAPSGVWVVDAKKWEHGTIEYKTVGRMSDYNPRLFVDGKDHTGLVDQIYSQVIPVAQVLDDPSVPIRPALVFMNGNWSSSAVPRMLFNKPYVHLGVIITWPKGLLKRITERGPLDADRLAEISSRLDLALRPR